MALNWSGLTPMYTTYNILESGKFRNMEDTVSQLIYSSIVGSYLPR
jgi:hypothetical protein